MALFCCEFKSVVLGQAAAFNVILPDRVTEDIPVVLLLHGLSGDQNEWLRYSSIERYANARGLAVVLPAANKSWYCDMKYGGKYATYITGELMEYVRRVFPITKKREKTFVAGLSMGGYGALKFALAESEKFAACGALSGALDIYERFLLGDRHEQGVQVWGENYLAELPGSIHDTYELAKRLEAAGKPKPWIFQACGTEDKRYRENQLFRRFIETRGYTYVYEERPGGHTWDIWDHYIPKVLDFFLRYMEENPA